MTAGITDLMWRSSILVSVAYTMDIDECRYDGNHSATLEKTPIFIVQGDSKILPFFVCKIKSYKHNM